MHTPTSAAPTKDNNAGALHARLVQVLDMVRAVDAPLKTKDVAASLGAPNHRATKMLKALRKGGHVVNVRSGRESLWVLPFRAAALANELREAVRMTRLRRNKRKREARKNSKQQELECSEPDFERWASSSTRRWCKAEDRPLPPCALAGTRLDMLLAMRQIVL